MIETMRRANKQCAGCPFRGLPKTERIELAAVPADEWPCHTEAGYSSTDIQCRGHWEAQKLAARTAEDERQRFIQRTDTGRFA